MVERRDTGISEGRLSDGVTAPALEVGRGMYEGDLGWSGTLRSANLGVDGRDSALPSLLTTTQLSAVRSRLVGGRSLSIESIDLTP
jgi:hypothetical protein